MRIETGVRGFEDVVGGGLPADRLYVVSGPPGSGKTTFAAHFVSRGALDGEKCLYLSMHESEKEIASDMAEFDIGFERALASGRLRFLNVLSELSEELLLPKSAGGFQSGIQSASERIVKFVEAHDIDRLVIDSTMLLRYFYDQDENAFIQFVSALKRSKATALLISEMTDPSSYADEHYLAHGVIFLHNYMEDGDMQRGLQVLKMRGTDIDTDVRGLEFGTGGLVVREDGMTET